MTSLEQARADLDAADAALTAAWEARQAAQPLYHARTIGDAEYMPLDSAWRRARDAWDHADAVHRAALAQVDREARKARRVERVRLADGDALQTLVPGVEPVSQARRELGALQASRAARRGAAPLPSGGLFDDTAIRQKELF